MPQSQRKSFSTQIKLGDKPGSFSAKVATLNVVDSDGDVVLPGALDGQSVSILPAHDSGSVSLGKAVYEERGDDLVVVGKFNLGVAAGKDWHEAIKFDLKNGDPVQEWSWDYLPTTGPNGEPGAFAGQHEGQEVRFLAHLDSKEVSPVLRGASVGTRTLSAKSAHKTETSDAVWDEGAEMKRKDKSGEPLWDGIGTPHHFADGKASTRACFAGIVGLNLDSKVVDRTSAYDHLAAHLKDAGIEPPELLDKPGCKLVDQVRLATWAAEAACARVEEVLADRAARGKGLSDEVAGAAVDMANMIDELHKTAERLSGMVKAVSDSDAVAQALAAYEVTRAIAELESAQ